MSEKITTEELDHLAELEAAATPGEWTTCQGDDDDCIHVDGLDWQFSGPEDAKLIAATRNALPALLEMARELHISQEIGGWWCCGRGHTHMRIDARPKYNADAECPACALKAENAKLRKLLVEYAYVLGPRPGPAIPKDCCWKCGCCCGVSSDGASKKIKHRSGCGLAAALGET